MPEELNLFQCISALMVNKYKNEGIWLGIRSKRNPSENPLGIKWSKDTIRVLRVYQSYNKEQKNKLNFQPRLRKLKQILNLWKLRIFSLEGKVLIIKTLGISQFTFLASVTDIPERL